MAPSALGMSGKLYVEGGVKKDYEVPRALEVDEIKTIVQEFANAAGVAVEVGFEGSQGDGCGVKGEVLRARGS